MIGIKMINAKSRTSLSIYQSIRFASKKSGGSTSNGRTSNPKFLGFKLMHNAQVEPGNIIIRQRGTQWHPGMNVGIGKDHTIFALKGGRVSLHYDIFRQRRLISVDDSLSMQSSSSLTLNSGAEKPLLQQEQDRKSLKTALMPTKQEMKQRLKDMIDVKLYLSLDPKGIALKSDTLLLSLTLVLSRASLIRRSVRSCSRKVEGTQRTE